MIVYGTGLTGQARERHIAGIPTGLAITAPDAIEDTTATVTAATNASRVTGYRVELAASPYGPATLTSGDQALEAGETTLAWTFTGISRAIARLWARVTYWSDPARPHTALREVRVIPDAPPITLLDRWPLDAAELRWDDRLRWPASTITVTPPTDTGTGGEVPTIPPLPTGSAGLRWQDALRWNDANRWKD